MSNINNQPLANPLSLSDQLAVWSSGNGDTRRASLTALLALFEESLSPVSNALHYLPFVGGVDTIVAASASGQAITALAAGDSFVLFPVGANTGAVTLAIDGLAAKSVYYANAVMTSGRFSAGVPVIVTYDVNGRFNVVSPIPQITAPVFLPFVGGVNTITAGTGSTVDPYYTGQTFLFFAASANTGAATININTLGAKALQLNGAACVGGELAAGVPAVIMYDGAAFQIVASGTFGEYARVSIYKFAQKQAADNTGTATTVDTLGAALAAAGIVTVANVGGTLTWTAVKAGRFRVRAQFSLTVAVVGEAVGARLTVGGTGTSYAPSTTLALLAIPSNTPTLLQGNPPGGSAAAEFTLTIGQTITTLVTFAVSGGAAGASAYQANATVSCEYLGPT